jgi:hypothetical protein
LNLKLRNSEYANGLTGKMARTPGSMENGSWFALIIDFLNDILD